MMKRLSHNFTRTFFTLVIIAQLSACATTQPAGELAEYDRYEAMNRQIFAFNQTLDKTILRPVASGYSTFLPKPVRHSVSNVFHNLYEPFTTVNDLLQGKPEEAADSTGRFILNTTLGIVGIFDVATPLGLPIHKEDFGQTFGKWGIGNGPYIMLPFFGPSTARDTSSLVLEWVFDPFLGSIEDLHRYTAKAINIVDKRAKLLGTEKALEMQLDPYIFLRESYLQNREKEMLDGKAEEKVDEFEEDLFKE